MNLSVDVAIIDCGMGNLFSVCRGCEVAGLRPLVTNCREEIDLCSGLILPGVGAFGDAMTALRRMKLVDCIRDYAASGRPVMGICLGIQLLMSESSEFGDHEGLGLISGSVMRFPVTECKGRKLKVPHIGWNRIHPAQNADAPGIWKNTLLDGLHPGELFYFVHSFHVCPDSPSVVLSTTRYGDVEFCSTLQDRNITAFQFHPERSGEKGLQVYRNFAKSLGT